jgi:hypothetical protein
MLTALVVLILLAVVLTIVSAASSKVPLWPAVFLLCVIQLLRILPIGK